MISQGHILSISLKAFWPFEILLLRILFGPTPYFLIGLFGILMSSLLSYLYILKISSISNVGLMKIFYHSVGYHFVLYTMSFALQKSVSGGPIY